MLSGKNAEKKLTAFERRQLEEQRKKEGGNMSIEDRLKRLKEMHEKRPPSGQKVQQPKQRVSTGMQ